jgi:hypothetical protein
MAIYRFETATAPWRSQPPPETALERWKDWSSRIGRARGHNLAGTTGLDVQTLETWHKRGWYELFHYRSPFAVSFSTGALTRTRSTSPSASKGQSPTRQQPSQNPMDYPYAPPTILHTLPAAEALPLDFSQLRNDYLIMLQNTVPQEMPVAEVGIPVDRQDAVRALMDALQGEPPQWSPEALMLNTHTAAPEFIAPDPTSSPQFFMSPIESPWDDFLQSPPLGDADFTPDVFTSPVMFDMVDSTFDGPFRDFLGVDAASSEPNAASSEPDATDPFAYIDDLLRTEDWSEGALKCIAYDSQCQQALRSLEGARAESMMRRLHQVGPTGVSLSVSLVPDSRTVDFCPSGTRLGRASAEGGVDACEVVHCKRHPSHGPVHPRRQHRRRPGSVDQRRLRRCLSGNVPWSAGCRQALAYPERGQEDRQPSMSVSFEATATA